MPQGRVLRVVFVLLFLTLGGAVGFGAAYLLYLNEIISWSLSAGTETLVLLVVAFASAVTVLLIGLARRSPRTVTSLLAGFLGLWLGFAGGVGAPGILGEVAAWNQKPGSVTYAFDTRTISVPAAVLEAVNSPLSGERSTHSFIAARSDGGLLMVSSAGSDIFDLIQNADERGLASHAIVSAWSPDWEVTDTVDLTEIDPAIHLVRSVFLDEAEGVLSFSVASVDTSCLGLQLWQADIAFSPLTVENPRKLYASAPCLDYTSSAQQYGGRIAQGDDATLFLSIGDYGKGFSTTRQEQLDGEYSGRPEELTTPGSSLGSVVAITPDGDSEIVSRGHRNPQGLTYDQVTGTLWLSEHGPKGGDELNLIEPGNDYGWPDVTYGGPYGGAPQPDPSWRQGRWFGQSHGAFTEPVLTWLPAIAASQVLVYRGAEFPAWEGNILLASFRGDIHRIGLVGDRVVFDEAIAIGERPRDMVQLADGRLVVATDHDELLIIGAQR